jgi:integrase
MVFPTFNGSLLSRLRGRVRRPRWRLFAAVNSPRLRFPVPGFHAGHAPGNKGLRYPADPPKVEEIVAVMRAAGDRAHGRRLRGLIAILWRSGLRIQEALALTEGDLDHCRGSLLVRRGKGGRRREVGMDAWGWEHLDPWLEMRRELPIGPLLCVINGTTLGKTHDRNWGILTIVDTWANVRECRLRTKLATGVVCPR